MRRATGSIRIFTFKEGLMSAVAHDLRVQLRSFQITLDGSEVKGEFDLKSLVVEGPMHNGVFDAAAYDESKRADVEKAMHDEVLHTHRHPTASFTGSVSPTGSQSEGYQVTGLLRLAGKSQPLHFDVRHDRGTYRAEFELKPSLWGISRYKALLGAIKLKDLLRIELALSEA
jgi:polyisoprenoid-binding protein YceI